MRSGSARRTRRSTTKAAARTGAKAEEKGEIRRGRDDITVTVSRVRRG